MQPAPLRPLLPGIDRRRWLAVLAGLACGSRPALAEPLPALIARVKRSVVTVGSYGLMDNPRFGFRAAGFAVGDGLLVLTNAHVVPAETPDRIDRSIAVQVWLGDDQWQLRSARLLGRDLRNDLALLAIDGPALPALKLAEQDAVEGTAIALMGFPIGKCWARCTPRIAASCRPGRPSPRRQAGRPASTRVPSAS